MPTSVIIKLLTKLQDAAKHHFLMANTIDLPENKREDANVIVPSNKRSTNA
jgi:hypothetical protein